MVNEIRVVPIVPFKSLTTEQRLRRITVIGGKWLEYNQLFGHILMIYRDASHLAVVLHCETSADSLCFEEGNPALVPRLYEHLINSFFDCLASKVIVYGSRMLLMGIDDVQFIHLSFSTTVKKTGADLCVTFDCDCDEPSSKDGKEAVFVDVDPMDLDLFMVALGDYVNEHVERPFKKIKK